MRTDTLFSSQPVSVVGVAASSLACQAGEAEAPRASTACLYAVRKGCGRERGREGRTVKRAAAFWGLQLQRVVCCAATHMAVGTRNKPPLPVPNTCGNCYAL